MTYIEPLPNTVRNILKQSPNTHPGLALDKYVQAYDPSAVDSGKLSELVQKPALDKVVQLSRTAPSGLDLERLLQRRTAMLGGLDATIFECTTAGPLTLHLSRASALENAGLCLHHLYGFTYLPGSGLKGMARAYAETVWLPGQKDQSAARANCSRIFGTGAEGKTSTAGEIIFHDAWPCQWPVLSTDILNNHNVKYYAGKSDPGDWDNPVPVYFLSVAAGTTFSFALSPRRIGTDPGLTRLAREWLLGALCHLGAGAKTNAGYGAFIPKEEPVPPLASDARAVFETEVELVTPAFLAGAQQGKDDCVLRPATLRGLMRWWWRTLHAGHVDRKTLQDMEAMIWGDTKKAGAVRITVQTLGEQMPQLFDLKQGNSPKIDFLKNNELQPQPNRKTSQGLFYFAYGMSDGGKKRWFILPGSKWKIHIDAKNSLFDKISVDKEIVLRQAVASLWLFTNYGGVGSKSRKGFGSLKSSINNVDHSWCIKSGQLLRDHCLPNVRKDARIQGVSINNAIIKEIDTEWSNYWYALDQIGYSAQSFAQTMKHNAAKKALGLPRKIGHPVTGTFREPETRRHSSPVHFHMHKSDKGALSIRIAAFPSQRLPDYTTSKSFLQKYVNWVKTDIRSHSAAKQKGKSTPYIPGSAHGHTVYSPAFDAKQVNFPNTGDKVETLLLEEKTKKGGWKAKHLKSELSGPVQNSSDVPSDKKPGDSVTLIVQSVNPREIAFRYPTAADAQKQKDGSHKQGKAGRGGSGSHGGRHGGRR